MIGGPSSGEGGRDEGTEGTEETEQALTRRRGDTESDWNSAFRADAGPAIGRAERSTDAPRAQAADPPHAACAHGASVDRPPRTRGGIGCTASLPAFHSVSPPFLRVSVFEARSVPSVPSVSYN
jgi:hypothetical protein